MKPLPAPKAAPTPGRSDPPSGVRRRPCRPPHLLVVLASVLDPKRRPRLRVGVSDAEDILQDTLLLFLEKHESLQPGAWYAWVYSTLRNREREFLKRRALRSKHHPLLAAYLLAHTPQHAEADARLRQQELLSALTWLLDQVAPSRRDVAERYLFDAVPLEEIAAETGRPLSTVGSQWRRAKEDMRAAIARERSKLDPVFVAVLLAIVTACYLWLADHGRRLAATLAAPFTPDLRRSTPPEDAAPRPPQLPKSRAARHRHGTSTPPRRPRTGAAAACAVLPLVLLKHVPLDVPPSPGAVFATSFDATAASLATEARHDGDARRHTDHTVFTPFRTTNAEPERDSAAAARTPHAAPDTRTVVPDTPVSPVLHKMARGFLARATEALSRGEVDIARDALRLYDTGIPGDPFPAERARIAAMLRGRGSR